MEIHNPFQEIIERICNIEDCLLRINEKLEKPEPITNKRLTIKEVCEMYNISKPTLHKQMHLGLAFEKMGRKTLFRKEVVEEYFKATTQYSMKAMIPDDFIIHD